MLVLGPMVVSGVGAAADSAPEVRPVSGKFWGGKPFEFGCSSEERACLAKGNEEPRISPFTPSAIDVLRARGRVTHGNSFPLPHNVPMRMALLCPLIG